MTRSRTWDGREVPTGCVNESQKAARLTPDVSPATDCKWFMCVFQWPDGLRELRCRTGNVRRFRSDASLACLNCPDYRTEPR